jgi:hypothetical protein
MPEREPGVTRRGATESAEVNIDLFDVRRLSAPPVVSYVFTTGIYTMPFKQSRSCAWLQPTGVDQPILIPTKKPSGVDGLRISYGD